MATAIILAGGIGNRSEQFVPKQFLTVNDIPVIVYTMLNIQKNPNIDGIVIVSAEGWENFIRSYAKQFGISKLKNVVVGGVTRIDSIRNGLNCIKDLCTDTKVLLTDANRPLVPQRVINDVITLVDECDCAIGAELCYDSMFISYDRETIKDIADRSILLREVGPECVRLSTLQELYSIVDNDVIDTTAAAMAVIHNKSIRIAKGHIKCFKITTAEDFELFKAFLAAEPLTNIVKQSEE